MTRPMNPVATSGGQVPPVEIGEHTENSVAVFAAVFRSGADRESIDPIAPGDGSGGRATGSGSVPDQCLSQTDDPRT
jgi:hypothetical protein